MPSSTKKRQREPEDWDYADLSGPDPMYKRTAPTCIPASSSNTFRVNTTAKGPDPYLTSYNSTFDSKAPYSYSYTPAATNAAAMTMPPVPYPSYSYNYLNMQRSQPQVQPQTQVQSPALPPAKKQRKKKNDPNEPPPEKRGAMFKKKCPQNILDRVDRVMSQRFFMVERKRNGDELREEFSVTGSTGNVSTPSSLTSLHPATACPDANKGNHCKHILFIFLKVLQVSQSSGLWYQKALLTSELQDIFAHAPPAPNSVVNQRVRDAYARATGKASATSEGADPMKKRRAPGPEDDCPICYEGMHNADENTLIWCETCANAVHKECFTQWAKSCGHNITCVFCRSTWIDVSGVGQSAGKGKAATVSEGYINLGAVAGLNQERDTSTYYHSSRRRHYGYQDYGNLF
ncbi:hypothetical protein AZE42_05712 [Rhizopogon vesiculosus]|uniref:RING-type domain-containing protein n=1 Tax=Rhizopogon vesiculosus TaxID=180088 RepID=A0A1J8QM32_9AGAM|nr:hypothetical protein AZE42_05712 [Rhizopogon vesiculosus]